MAYEVLARKWRPRQFDDVVGQTHVTTTLRNALKTGRLAHAYLFTGPRGVGKTSVARILAKALNCAEGPTDQPCDRCDACREIASGVSLDVLEIDGASNNSVDQVRELRESARFAPMRGRYKVYLIDEVHMLSTGAFNALLKTLEEPPEHVKFFFATTEPEKVPATIISRCQRFDLRRIPVPLIVERLRAVAQAEGIAIDEDALLAVARGAEGGLRDAESALDQLIAFRGKQIEEKDVLSIFGLVARGSLEALAESVLRGDAAGVLRIVAEVDEAGKDLLRFVVELMEHFRHLLVCLSVENPGPILSVTDSQIEVLKKQAALSDTERVLRIANILAEAEERMHYALSRRVLLETALIRCARAAVTVTVEDLLRRLENWSAESGRGAGAPAPPETVASASPVRPPAGAAPTPPRIEEATPRPTESPATSSTGDELARLRAEWPRVVAAAGRVLLSARTLLTDARPAEVAADRVVLQVDPEFGETALSAPPRNRRAVEAALSEFLGRRVQVEWTVGEVSSAEVKHSDDAPAEPPAGPVADSGPGQTRVSDANERSDAGTGDQAALIETWSRNSTVQEVMKLFGGRVVEVRE